MKTIVVLIRYTTWQCGKLERAIIKHLHKKKEVLSKREISSKEIMKNSDFAIGKRKEFYEALHRLEKRRTVILLPL